MTSDWLWNRPDRSPLATLLLAHGAGAPMDSEFMQAMAERLAARGIQVIRFEFPYMAQRRVDGKRRPPSRAPQLLAHWHGQIASARAHVGPQTLLIGGKSMGGRMASLVADEADVAGLVCLGYPFYAPGKPERPRTEHLVTLRTPGLIVQGTRDALGDRDRVSDYPLSPALTLHWLDDGDHDLKPRVKSGYTHMHHLEAAADAVADFARRRAQT